MLTVEIPVITTHGEAARVLVRVKEPDSAEVWYAEILHGVIPLAWLAAWASSLAPKVSRRFDGVVLSGGPDGQVLLSVPPEIIDRPLAAADLARLLGS